MENKNKTPVIFVTGIGQTWASVKGDNNYSWNLIPSKKEIMLRSFSFENYLKVFSVGVQSLFTLISGKKHINTDVMIDVISSLMSCCVVDKNGRLPDEVDLKIYGPRSFDKLRHVDLYSNKECDDFEKSMLSRIYKDIPCEVLAEKCGEENLYCFNYSPFSDIYKDADNLHQMIKDVIEDQKQKTGSQKVVLVPMSMGASVVSAYIDKYYSDNEDENAENLVSKIISIVGAWNGSDGLSNLITFNTSDDFAENISELTGNKAAEFLKKFSAKGVETLFEDIINAVVRGVIIRNTSFMALVPKERYFDVADRIFAGCNDEYLNSIKEKSKRYYNAQCNLTNRLVNMEKYYGVKSYFISGYNKKFGQESRDFGFLSLFDNDKNTNTDSVIQVTSTTPGALSFRAGESVLICDNNYLSPDKSVYLGESPFKDRIWMFENQYHEIGTNNTALKIAAEIALGNVESINDGYPQFNRSRDIKGIYSLLEKAENILSKQILPETEKENLTASVDQVKGMINNTENNPEYDNKVMDNFRKEMNRILL